MNFPPASLPQQSGVSEHGQTEPKESKETRQPRGTCAQRDAGAAWRDVLLPQSIEVRAAATLSHLLPSSPLGMRESLTTGLGKAWDVTYQLCVSVLKLSFIPHSLIFLKWANNSHLIFSFGCSLLYLCCPWTAPTCCSTWEGFIIRS